MRKVIHIASALMAAVLAFISCERADVNRPDVQEGGRPIQFTVESEWPEITKAVITDVEDVAQSGFTVWATWFQDPDDDSSYTKENEVVFGKEGTSVQAADPQAESLEWVADMEAEWNRGYYNFAALLPQSSDFSFEHTSSFSKYISEAGRTLEYSNLLTISLPETGFSLGGTNPANDQIDLMYAFHNEDNSAETSSEVPFQFNHVFSMLKIQLDNKGSTPAIVNKVTIYGIHKTIHGQLKIRQNKTITKNETEEITTTTNITNNLADLLNNAPITTSTQPFAEITPGQLNYGVNPVLIVDNLLVFPEEFSKNTPLTIQIDCTVGGTPKELSAIITTGSWEAGSTYLYSLQVIPET